MMRALLLLAVLGCDAGAMAKPSTFVMPALSLHAPYVHSEDKQEYALRDGRLVRYDQGAQAVSLYDPATKHETNLGRAWLVAVPRMGWLVMTRDADDSMHLQDIDPTKPALREVWHGANGEWGEVVGTLDGGIVLRVGGSLVTVSAPGVSTRLAVQLPAKLEPVSGDAIRGHRLLLETAWNEQVVRNSSFALFPVPVSILELDTGQTRSVGMAMGGWTIATDMPHSYANVRWSDHDEGVRSATYNEPVVNAVDATTEKLTQHGLYPGTTADP